MRIDYPNVHGTIEVYMDVMRAICGDTSDKSMIDLMCNTAPNTPRLGFKGVDYIDILDRKLDHPDQQKYFLRKNVLEIDPVKEALSYDVAICSDGIEHVTFEDGLKLLDIMDKLADLRIIFTPLDDLFGMAKPNQTDPEMHRSLWKPEDFPGYAAIVFPDYHKVWNGGAAFYFKSLSTKYDFDRVVNELKSKPWARH